MSSDDEQDGHGAEDESPASSPAAKQPAVAKKPSAAKRPAAKGAEEGDSTTVEQKPATAKRTAAAKTAAAAKEPAAKTGAAAKKSAAAEEPVAQQKPAPAENKEPAVEQSTRRKEQKGVAAAPRRRVVRAQARYVRTSARKARMVCGHLRGKSVPEARAILAFTPREVARDWSKLLESAVANAEHNHELVEDDLIVREAYADEGPTLKRFRPRAMGRATPIRKRTSHLTITLTPGP